MLLSHRNKNKIKGSDLDMKKHVALFSSALMMSTTLLGAGSVFADDIQPDPAESSTPVTAELTKDPAPEPVLPGGTVDGTDHDNNHVSGDLGIAYQPNSLTGHGKLVDNGRQEIELANNSSITNHVGVKDTTRQQHKWNLTAKVAWTGDNAKYMEGTSIQLSGGQVQMNNDGELSPVTEREVTGEETVNINSVPVNVMTSDQTKTQNGVYDYGFNSTKLIIPNVEQVPANTYTGKIDWNLALVPEV